MVDHNDDEWTFVPAKKSRRPQVRSNAILSGPDKDATVESLTTAFTIRQKSWTMSIARKEVFDILGHLRIYDQPQVTKAVCLGLGAFSTSNLTNRERSMTQLAVFLDISQHLSSRSGQVIELYAQEPKFESIDEEFLASLTITTLSLPAGNAGYGESATIGPASTHIDETTFVADFFVETSIAQQLLTMDMGLLLSTLPQLVSNKQDRSVEAVEVVEKFKRRYRWYEFPDASSYTMALHGLYLCGQQQVEESD